MRALRRTVAAAVAAAAFWGTAVSADDLLILSAFPTEQAVLLSHAQPVTEVGVFNGRRFFRGTIAGKSVVLGLTGIGLVDAEATASAVLDSIEVDGIIFSGVAGGSHHIGDVIVPDHWTEGANSYPVDAEWYATARALAGNVALDPCLPVEDATCTGQRLPERTPVCIADAPGQTGPQVYFGGRGNSADPFGGRAVPCLSGAGSLEGCEACGAPPNTSPGIVPFVSDAAPFADPFFLIDLFQSFAPGGGGPDPYPNDPIVVADMETAAVARVAAARHIPFLAFRALSDSDAADHGGDPLMLPGFPVMFVYAQLAADNAAAAVIAFLDRRSPRPKPETR